MSTNIKYNKANDAIGNELEFDSNISLANNHIKDKIYIVTVRVIGGNQSRQTLKLGLPYLLDSGATDRMINRKYINPY